MSIFGRAGAGAKGTLQLVQRGTDKLIPVEFIKDPSGEVLDPDLFENLIVSVTNERSALCATPPVSISGNTLIIEMTADVTRHLGLGVCVMTAKGRIPDEAYHDGYHDYEVVIPICKITKYGSNETPVKVTAKVLEGLKGKDGKSAYDIVVKHGYQGTEEQFAKDIIPKSNYERAKELQGFQGTEVDYLVSLQGAPGKDLYQAAVERGYKGSFDDFLEQQKGAPGAPGKSNYELAQEDGFTGTITEYLASKKGDKGDDAYQVYLQETDDNPKLSRKEWSDTIGSFANLIKAVVYGTEQ